MTVSQAQQFAEQGRQLEALEVLAPLLRNTPPPQGASLEYAKIAFRTAFRFLGLEAAQREALYYPRQEVQDFIASIQQFATSHRQTRTDLPKISLIAVASLEDRHDWLRCLASLNHQSYSHIEVVLVCESPQSSWGELPPFVSYLQSPTKSVPQPQLLTQAIQASKGDLISVIERPRTVFSDVGLSIIASLSHDFPHLKVLQGHRLYSDERYIFKQARISEPSWSQALLLDITTIETPSVLFSWRGVFFKKEVLTQSALPFRSDILHTTALEAAIKISRSTPIYTVSAPILVDDARVEAKSFYLTPEEKVEALALINDELHHIGSTASKESPRLIQPKPGPRKECKLPKVSPGLLDYGAAAAPVISLITPVLNCADYIERCIDSVLSQNYKNLEFMILDGGSTDGTQEIIRRYQKHLAFWRSGPDAGHYASVQDGFARSTGTIMSWINADDALVPYSLHLVAALFSAQTGIEWLTGQHCIFTEKRELETGDPMIIDSENYYNDGFDEPFIQQEGTFWSRKLWDRAGGSLDLSLDLAADMELWTRFFMSSKLFVASVPLGIFQRRAGQRSAMFRMRYYQEAWKVTQRLKAAGIKPFEDPTEKGAFVPIPCEP